MKVLKLCTVHMTFYCKNITYCNDVCSDVCETLLHKWQNTPLLVLCYLLIFRWQIIWLMIDCLGVCLHSDCVHTTWLNGWQICHKTPYWQNRVPAKVEEFQKFTEKYHGALSLLHENHFVSNSFVSNAFTRGRHTVWRRAVAKPQQHQTRQKFPAKLHLIYNDERLRSFWI